MNTRLLAVLGISLCVVLTVAFTTTTMAAETPRMSKEELKAMLDSPDLIILDVRVGRDWKASEYKIRGAVRVDATDFGSWANKFPKDKTLVLYCA
ncbi:MAG: hypothetical protein JSU72_02415 [Deltaproteobacteria bacterium]|nr:MAG: hypothetical protein JSU72_02415 [Deltaproteobacteria bacterium]